VGATGHNSGIPRGKRGNATSLFNLMRNIGGSIGTAVTGTMLARQRQTVAVVLGEHITVYDRPTQSILAQLGVIFLCMIPLVLIMKRAKPGGGAVGAP